MEDYFKEAKGWEKWGSETFLRMEISKPRITQVWPGANGQTELRRLTDTVLTREDIYKVLSDPVTAVESGYSSADLKMLREALERYPRRETGARRKEKSVPTNPFPGGPG